MFLVLQQISSKTPVTHGRMYCRIVAGYQIWKIVSDLRIIFSSVNMSIPSVISLWHSPRMCCVHGHTMEKSTLLEFSVKGLRILDVINIHITSVYNPQSVHKVLAAYIHVLESSMPIKTRENVYRYSRRVFGGCKDATGSLQTLPETTRINRHGPWRRSRI